MSVAATSIVTLLLACTKIVFGTVIGVVFVSGGAATSMRTTPVTVLTSSVTTYSM
jgi:hypothetical protein